MTAYTEAAHAPSIDNSLLFNDDPRINIIDIDPRVTYTRERFKIPGADGELDIGGTPNGMAISLQLEIGDDVLSDFHARKAALLSALQGDGDGKFEFYLRYIDADNFWKYTKCVLNSFQDMVGRQDAKQNNLNNQFSVEILSEDTVPSVKENGSFVEGSTEDTTTANLLNTSKIYISDNFIVQNEAGEIKFNMDANLQKLTIVGVLDESL